MPNYATWNPADKSANITLSDADLTATAHLTLHGGVRSTLGMSEGLWYWEITAGAVTANDRIGIGTVDMSVAGFPFDLGSDTDNKSWGLSPSGNLFHDGASIAVYTAYIATDIIMIAINLNTHKLWIGREGTWFNSGDPAAGTGEVATINSVAYYPMLTLRAGSGAYTANFGASAFTYSVPAGFESGLYALYQGAIEESLVSTDLNMSNAFNSIDEGLSLTEVLGEKYPMLSDDILTLIDRTRGGYIYDKTTESFIIISDLSLMSFFLSILEVLGLTDTNNPGLFEDLNEALSLVDAIYAPYFIVIQDGFFIWPTPKANWEKLVAESLVVTDLATKTFGFTTDEWLHLVSTVQNMWHGSETAESSLGVYDLPTGTKIINRTIEEAITAEDAISIRFLKTILERLHFDAVLSLIQQYETVLSESLSVVDSASRAFDKLIEEILSAIDVATVVPTFYNAVAESLSSVDAVTGSKHIGSSASESLVFTETVISQGTLYSAVYEKLRLNITVEMDGEVWECYVLNTPKFYPSMYSGFDFNSYCVHQNRAFGANDTGIYELTGTTDAGAEIHTGVILHETDFGLPNQKRFRRGYFGISGTSPVVVFDTGNGQREVYNIDSHGKVVANSDLKSKSWTISIADFDALDTIKLIPVILTK